MSDDKEADQIPEPDSPEPQQPSASVPFVPYDDTANMTAIFSHYRRISPGSFDTNNQVFPPLVLRAGPEDVVEVDLGIRSAAGFWELVVLPNYEAFKADPNPASAVNSAWAAWQLHDWIWHEQDPKEGKRAFQGSLFTACPEIGWIRDVADASKHRRLNRRNVQVREIANNWPMNASPRSIILRDGTEHDLADVLALVIEYWRANYFS